MSSRISSRVFIFLLLLAVVASVAQNSGTSGATAKPQSASKPEIKKVPPVYTDPSSGRQMYDAYCASCHGQGGKGNGPAAPALKTMPTDLTTLAAHNGGKFPEAHVMQVIRGDSETAAHGNKEMPVWGPIFSSMAQQDEAAEQLRIRNLTRYVESLQQK